MEVDSPQFVLFEHATGYALFRVKEFEEIGHVLSEVEASVQDLARFSSVVKLVAFTPFLNAVNALENCNALSDGTVHSDLFTFLETNLPKAKKSKTKLGVGDGKLAMAIYESLPYIHAMHGGVIPELFRGLRCHFSKMIKGLTAVSCEKAQLGLGHSYSRAKVKFNVHRVDNMIIQSISLLDQLDKNINTFAMRIREWYSYHFPELFKIIPDQYTYCLCALLIRDRKSINQELLTALTEITKDESKTTEILEASKASMGMDISEIDLINIERFSKRVIALADYRKQLQTYLQQRMAACAPSLSALIGEQVGARLISHAGSLTNLAKYPASTIQILGAEKALFRALKTRGNTPKYGLLFHSTFIGRAQAKNKGRISRYLANKCALASRIDCFSDIPTPTFGDYLRNQVDDRLKFFESGEAPKKNADVMHEAAIATKHKQAKLLKKRKKIEKKQAELEIQVTDNVNAIGTVENELKISKKRKKDKMNGIDETGIVFAESALETAVLNGFEIENETKRSKKKKKKQSADLDKTEIGLSTQVLIDESITLSPTDEQSVKKKKKRKTASPIM